MGFISWPVSREKFSCNLGVQCSAPACSLPNVCACQACDQTAALPCTGMVVQLLMCPLALVFQVLLVTHQLTQRTSSPSNYYYIPLIILYIWLLKFSTGGLVVIQCRLSAVKQVVKSGPSPLHCLTVKPAASAKVSASALRNSRRRCSWLHKVLSVREGFHAGIATGCNNPAYLMHRARLLTHNQQPVVE